MSERESGSSSEDSEEEEEEEEEVEEEEDEGDDDDDDDDDEEEGIDEEEAEEEEEAIDEEEEEEEEEEDKNALEPASGDEESEDNNSSDVESDENDKKRTLEVAEEGDSSETDDDHEREKQVPKQVTKNKIQIIKPTIEPIVTNSVAKPESIKSSEVRTDPSESNKSAKTNSEAVIIDIQRKVVPSNDQGTQTDEETSHRHEEKHNKQERTDTETSIPKIESKDAYSMTDHITRKEVETSTENLPYPPNNRINQHVQKEDTPTMKSQVTSERSGFIQTGNDAISPPSLRERSAPPSSLEPHTYMSDKTVQVNFSDVTSVRRVRTQTKLKHYNVRTITSGLIKTRTMQTCTSGLKSSPDQKDRGTNTDGVAIRSRGTQTKDKYVSLTSVTHEKKTLTVGEASMSTKPAKKETTELVPSQPSQTSNKAKVPKLKLLSELDRYSSEVILSKDLEKKTPTPESPTGKDPGSRDIKDARSGTESEKEMKKESSQLIRRNGENVREESEDESNKKIRKEKENHRRRRRRRWGAPSMPDRHLSPDKGRRPHPQRNAPPRPKSAKLLPKRKSAPSDGRPLSAAQYRMLYHSRWADIPV
uniref:Cilia- and flagella-associated protein 251-like n=1 Tax=Crassostrea virginica TaxID=6565 RepID=A0A8B8E9Q1_CRAVI|nr:cilia- and flagella-associated protein 251-like [Crassostrea virginica]